MLCKFLEVLNVNVRYMKSFIIIITFNLERKNVLMMDVCPVAQEFFFFFFLSCQGTISVIVIHYFEALFYG